MSRFLFPITLTVVIGAAAPAYAQFGSIFGNNPPRPPASIGRDQPREDRPPPTLQQPGPPPGRALPPPNVESEPLPPPPGARTVPGQPPATQPAQRPQQPQQQQQQQQAQPQQPEPPPSDETIAEPPASKIPNPTSVFAGLDKITGRITSFDVAIGETVQFGALQVTPRACYTRPPTEQQHTDAFIEVDEVTLQGEIRRIYTGWMFAASPGLHAVEHPIYDIWLTDCKGGAVAEAQPEPEPQQQQPRGTRAQQQQQRQQPAQRRPTQPRDF